MKTFKTAAIRNVGIVGHGGTGKTQLASALLFAAGATDRLGKPIDGTAVTDWDEEEIARKISIQTGLAYLEWPAAGDGEKTKINLLDTPGYSAFLNETKASPIATDAALILVESVAGVQVVCFFQSSQKFKTRYATLGFSDKANLDDGAIWPTGFALKELTPAEEAKIAALVKKAVS